MSDTTPAAASSGTQALPSAAQVAAHLEALNLTGLGFAVKRLLGRDPMPVAGQFTMWARAGRPDLPSLTQDLWEALAPLRIGRPAEPAAALCDQVLRDAESDGAAGLQAAEACGTAGKSLFAQAQLAFAPRDIRAEALRQKALVSSIKDYWRSLGTLYGELRPHVVAGDHEGAMALLAARLQALRRATEDIGRMAAGVAGVEQPPDPVVEPVFESVAVGTVEGGPVVSEPAFDPALARAEAFAQARPLHAEDLLDPEDEDARPVEVLSTRPVRNHPFLPIVFLLLVSAVALYTLFRIINDPTNPLQ